MSVNARDASVACDWQSALVLGGARSGKTRRALALAECRPQRVYIATAEAWDDEMRHRIRLHQDERDETWTTIETPLDLTLGLEQAAASGPGVAIVVDCLTLWINNLMHHERDVAAETKKLAEAVSSLAAAAGERRVIFVSNEVGLGIVPENAMARAFRDHQGRVNQTMAAAVDRVEFIAAGLPMVLKTGAEQPNV